MARVVGLSSKNAVTSLGNLKKCLFDHRSGLEKNNVATVILNFDVTNLVITYLIMTNSDELGYIALGSNGYNNLGFSYLVSIEPDYNELGYNELSCNEHMQRGE